MFANVTGIPSFMLLFGTRRLLRGRMQYLKRLISLYRNVNDKIPQAPPHYDYIYTRITYMLFIHKCTVSPKRKKTLSDHQ